MWQVLPAKRGGKESPNVVVAPPINGRPLNKRRRRDVILPSSTHTPVTSSPRRASALKPAVLIVHQTNQTLPTSYCDNEACRSGTGLNASYSVPLHWSFPFVFVGLVFQ